jgi:signal transduction histidine kinase
MFGETFVPALRNGAPSHLWGTATQLFDSEGKQVGAIESIRDITDYKRAEEEKLRLESQLSQAHMIETSLARLGHDLKTPLTPLFILLPLLKKRLSEPDLIKKVDMCMKSAAALNNLADKSRILATLSSTVDPSEQERISLASMVDRSLADYENAISKKQIDCQNNVDREVVIHVVPEQLNILINNLISNAVYFSYEKGVIVISAEQNAESVTFSIQDEGIGLTPSHLDHVFDELFKADSSRHNINTTGLGLSICKRIVQNHHGRIWAESPGLGKGTTFRFTIDNQSVVSPMA